MKNSSESQLGRPKKVTYEMVSEACRRLAAKNNGVFSCKDVLTETGCGSMSSIHPMIQTWRDQNPSLHESAMNPSDKFLGAFGAEVDRICAKKDEQHRAELKAKEDDTEYLRNVLLSAEEKLQETEQCNASQRDKLTAQAAILESLQDANRKLDEALAVLNSERLDACSKLARAEIRLEHYPLVQQELAEVKKQLELERMTSTRVANELAGAVATIEQMTIRLAESSGAPEATRGRSESTNQSQVAVKVHAADSPSKTEIGGGQPQHGDCKSNTNEINPIAYFTEAALQSIGPMGTQQIMSALVEQGVLEDGEKSLKQLAAHLRASRRVSFNSKSECWIAIKDPHQIKN